MANFKKCNISNSLGRTEDNYIWRNETKMSSSDDEQNGNNNVGDSVSVITSHFRKDH